jgi:hypothetical protein
MLIRVVNRELVLGKGGRGRHNMIRDVLEMGLALGGCI